LLGEPFVSVPELETVDLDIYPLPVAQELNFGDDRVIGSQLEIIDMKGQVVFRAGLNALTLDLSFLETGVYHLQLIGDDWTANEVLVKE
jgi:hypothetical protein